MTALTELGQELAQELEIALPAWVEARVRFICQAWALDWSEEIANDTQEAGKKCATEVGLRLRQLLESGIDQQDTNPMSILRSATNYPTQVLKNYDIPPIERDDFSEDAFPDDVYGLTPAAFADFGQTAHELGIAWGAAKAHTHFSKRREAQS
jgi:hypothetical protein